MASDRTTGTAWITTFAQSARMTSTTRTCYGSMQRGTTTPVKCAVRLVTPDLATPSISFSFAEGQLNVTVYAYGSYLTATRSFKNMTVTSIITAPTAK